VLANDYDVDGDRLTATLVTGPANGNLTLKADGSFIYTPLANFHGQVSFSYATGAGIHLSDPTTVVISVQGVNDSPFAIDDAGQAAFVGDTVRFTRNELLANDTDIDGDPLNLISVQDATDGSVQLVNGEIVFSVSARATTQASFSYTVSDNQGGFATAMVRIPLMARPNQAPEISSEATAQINENQTAVMTVTGTDPDADTTIVYGISGGADAALFTIDALTGALAFRSAPDFEAPADANGNNVYEVVILASDGALTSTQELAVTVTNVNDIRPVIGSNGGAANAVISIPENGTLVTTVTATDPDAQSGSTITYAITGGADAALFTIDSKTGVLRFETAPNFERPIDAGADNIYNLVVAASDKDLSTQQSITVNVTDLVEAPTKTFTGTALADAFAINDGEGWIISGLAGNDSLTGGDKADLLVGGKNSDILIGGGGDDVFSFAAGDGVDSYDGGGGFDKIIATTANAIIGIGTITGIEAISSGGFANVSIIGTTAADTFDFSNTLLTGIVQIDPGSGNDTVIGSTGSDTIVLGSGNDVFRAGEGDDIFIARTGAGSDVIDGGAGFDTIKAAAANAAINVAALVSIEAISANGFTGISLVGSSLAEVLDFSGMTLTGITVIDAGSGNDSVIGSAGSDIISLGTGNDNFSGGDGDDVFLAKASAGLDTVNGGNGHDIIVAAGANVSLTLAAFSGIEEISANGFSGVKLVGTSVADIMNYAGMTLTGIESINGGSGNDTITGSQANDRIMGDGGRDIVTGGAGADTFVFATTADSGVGSTKADYITDFVSGSDKIDLIAIDADTSLPGDQAFAFIGSAAFTGLGQLRIGVDSEGNVALFGNTTGSLAADFQISFGNAPVLTPTDLYL
jgi:Ca2+-binding RTX toxin-like protein